MTRREAGVSLLEILVYLTILMIVTAVTTLSALRPVGSPVYQTAVNVCALAAIRERRTVTIEANKHFVVCRADGRILLDGQERLTLFSEP